MSPSTPKPTTSTSQPQPWELSNPYSYVAASPPATPKAPQSNYPMLNSPSTPPVIRRPSAPSEEFQFSTPPSNSQAFGSPNLQGDSDNPFSTWRQPQANPIMNRNYFHPIIAPPPPAPATGGIFAQHASLPPRPSPTSITTSQAE